MAQANNAFITTGGPGGVPAAAQFTPVEAAYIHLVAGFTGTKPHCLASTLAEAVDFDDVPTAVHTHVDAVVHDTADKTPVIIDRVSFSSRVLFGCAEELIGELERCSVLFRSAEYRFQWRGA